MLPLRMMTIPVLQPSRLACCRRHWLRRPSRISRFGKTALPRLAPSSPDQPRTSADQQERDEQLEQGEGEEPAVSSAALLVPTRLLRCAATWSGLARACLLLGRIRAARLILLRRIRRRRLAVLPGTRGQTVAIPAPADDPQLASDRTNEQRAQTDTHNQDDDPTISSPALRCWLAFIAVRIHRKSFPSMEPRAIRLISLRTCCPCCGLCRDDGIIAAACVEVVRV